MLNITPKLKQYMVDNHELAADADEKSAREAVTKAIAQCFRGVISIPACRRSSFRFENRLLMTPPIERNLRDNESIVFCGKGVNGIFFILAPGMIIYRNFYSGYF